MNTDGGVLPRAPRAPKGCVPTGHTQVSKKPYKVGDEMKERVIAAAPIYRHTWPEHNRSKYKPHIGKKQGSR